MIRSNRNIPAPAVTPVTRVTSVTSKRVVKCFMIEETKLFDRVLRRFSLSEKARCSVGSYHNAIVPIDRVPFESEWSGGDLGDFVKLDDPRWPTKCDACPYIFTNEDYRQQHWERLFRNPQDDSVFQLRRAPAGSMWNSDWASASWRGADGWCLTVMLPDGIEWMIDGPSRDSNGKRGPSWTRTGAPPMVTARPSILTPSYHGFLTNGELIEC